MHSAIPLKLQISSWADKAQGLFLAFLGNTGCIYSVLQDDIFRHCLSHNLKQAHAASMYTSLGHGGKHAAVTSLKMLWQNQGTLLFSFTELAMLSHHWSPSRNKDMLHKNCTRNSRFRKTMSVSATKPKLPSPHSHQWNAVQVWDSMRLYVRTSHTSTQSCVGQNRPVADLQPAKLHQFWTDSSRASTSP